MAILKNWVVAIGEDVGFLGAYFLLDASVNQSNSGGPLIDVSGNVIGIITRKDTGLSKQFDELRESFNRNIPILKQLTGVIVGGNGVDLFSHLSETQDQMRNLSSEILRSANVGIGYAFAIEYLSKELERL